MTVLKKSRADISIMVAVFCVAFLAFCAFGIDMAYVTLNRIKLQRATETTAMASIARYKSTDTDDTQNLFTLFKSRFDTLDTAKVTSVEFKKTDDSYKIALSTEMMSPTYFLRFAGVGGVKIEAKSYAQTYEQNINDKQYGDLIELDNPMTDKKGNEFEIKSSPDANGYFVFAGTKNENGKYLWADVGCKSDTTVTVKNIEGKNYNLICAKDAKFDLSKACADNIAINVVKYLKVYGAAQGDCGGTENIFDAIKDKLEQKFEQEAAAKKEAWQKKFPLKDKEGNDIAYDKLKMPEMPKFSPTLDWLKDLMPVQSQNPYEIKILNNVKLITRDDF